MNVSVPIINTQISRRTLDTTRPLRYSVLTVICGSVVIIGFFFAARQHFSSIEYGMKNSRLRKQLDELEAEKRRLLLAKEVSMSPNELEKAVKRVSYVRTTSALNNVPGTERTNSEAIVRVSSTIQKTALSKPVLIVDERAQKLDHPSKRDPSAKDKKS